MALLPVRRSLDVQWDVAPMAAQHAVELPEDPTATLELTVRERREESDGVVSLTLVDPAGRPLPVWRPGAHIDVHVDGYARQYSLCSPGGDQRRWRVGVLKEANGRGGSLFGDRVRFVPEDTDGRVDFAACLLDIRPETLIYCCGPEPLLNVVEGASAHWPVGSLHVERFVPKQIDASGDVAFEVEFVDSGVTLTIPADKSILEVAQAAGLPALSSCSERTCGTCETPVISGAPDHRDSILTDDEKAGCDSMFICVSRSQGGCPLKLGL